MVLRNTSSLLFARGPLLAFSCHWKNEDVFSFTNSVLWWICRKVTTRFSSQNINTLFSWTNKKNFLKKYIFTVIFQLFQIYYNHKTGNWSFSLSIQSQGIILEEEQQEPDCETGPRSPELLSKAEAGLCSYVMRAAPSPEEQGGAREPLQSARWPWVTCGPGTGSQRGFLAFLDFSLLMHLMNLSSVSPVISPDVMVSPVRKC